MTFRGTYDYSLDAKSRLAVPPRYREVLKAGVVLAKAEEPCIALWTPQAYDAYVDAVLGPLPAGSRDWQKLNRFYAANSHETDLDAAGRVMVPPALLQHADLGKEVVVTGAGAWLEIWDRARWADYNVALSAEIPDLTERLGHTA